MNETFPVERAAFAAGKRVQYYSETRDAWRDTPDPIWMEGLKYRVHPYDIDPPAPEPFIPKTGQMVQGRHDVACPQWAKPFLSTAGENSYRECIREGWQYRLAEDPEWTSNKGRAVASYPPHLTPETMVEVKLRDGSIHRHEAGLYPQRWVETTGAFCDIVEYRVLSPFEQQTAEEKVASAAVDASQFLKEHCANKASVIGLKGDSGGRCNVLYNEDGVTPATPADISHYDVHMDQIVAVELPALAPDARERLREKLENIQPHPVDDTYGGVTYIPTPNNNMNTPITPTEEIPMPPVGSVWMVNNSKGRIIAVSSAGVALESITGACAGQLDAGSWRRLCASGQAIRVISKKESRRRLKAEARAIKKQIAVGLLLDRASVERRPLHRRMIRLGVWYAALRFVGEPLAAKFLYPFIVAGIAWLMQICSEYLSR